MMEITCTKCGAAYPNIGLPYRCDNCGGFYDFDPPLNLDPLQVDRSQPGIWRYRHTFGLSSNPSKIISLGEGNTPLIWKNVFGRKIAFKCENKNPSGSFKDRGSAVITAWLKSRNIECVVEDSSGNAGASLAAYAARGQIKARIFVPDYTSDQKCRLIEAFSAVVIRIPGSRDDVAEAVRVEADGGVTYASHAYLPFNIPGYATAAYEIFEQLGKRIPGAIILPVGQGGLLLGLARGFDALRIAYNIYTKPPRIIGVQVCGWAPLWERFENESETNKARIETRTLAEGVCVKNPLRVEAIIKAIGESGGSMCVTDENEIIPGCDALNLLGFFVEPTSAIVWSALIKKFKDIPDPIVVILTGSGKKNKFV
jgi:threonine synthase